MKGFSKLGRYALAPISCGIALAVARPLEAPASCFTIAVIVSSFYGGRGPGLLSAGLSTISFAYFFLEPIFSQRFELVVFLRFATFLGSILLICTLLEGKRRVEESGREQSNLLNLTHDSIFVRDMQNVITYWNRGAEEFYGWTAEKAVGQMTHKLLQTVFPAPLDEINAELLNTGRWEGELVHLKADGTQAVVASRWSLQRDERQHPLAILELNNDVTERKRVQERLQRSEAYLSEAQKLSHTGSFGWWVSTGGIWWSEESFRIFAYDQTTTPTVELILRRVHPDDADFVKRTIERAAQEVKDLDFEYRLLMPDAPVKCIHVVAAAQKAMSGELEFVGAVMDVTNVKEAENKIKRAEEALRQAQGELAHVTRVTTMGELTASIAHEVNQPLSAVVANGNACLRWLQADPPNLAKVREAAERIVRDGRDAGEIVQRVRGLFKRTGGEKLALDLNAVIGEVLRLLRNDAASKRIIVETDLDKNLPVVLGDRIQLQQVLLNLILNGIEAMEQIADRPKKLVIHSSREGADTALVAIRDHGVGIQDPDKVFDAFFTTKQNGMGMGLAICRSIIDAHEGRLWIAPGEGPGATICFTLPVQSNGAP